MKRLEAERRAREETGLEAAIVQQQAPSAPSSPQNRAAELLEHGVLTNALRNEVRQAALGQLIVPIARALTELASLRAA